jgi:DNA-binding NtrC family response regulator
MQLIGTSNAICEIKREVEDACQSDAKVLIIGESGVGKEVVAGLIHRGSRQRAAPFVPINCAGVPDSLLESELFGHVRGSFTDAHRDQKGWIEQAKGGTIFLDEVGEMSVRMQAILLRFLESGEIQRVGAERASSSVKVRVIAATNRNLWDDVNQKRFREDLYYRLNVIQIAIPPLRERREDIRPLVNRFIQTAAFTHGLPVPRLMEETLECLERHSWPGNVRELKNVAERLLVRARTGVIPPEDLPNEVLAGTRRPVAAGTEVSTQSVADRLFDRMFVGGANFWSVVYEPFMARDITRDDLRGVVARGLEHTRGSYKQMLHAFNVPADDYKRLLSFLRKYGCHMPFQKFRSLNVEPSSLAYHRETEQLTKAG